MLKNYAIKRHVFLYKWSLPPHLRSLLVYFYQQDKQFYVKIDLALPFATAYTPVIRPVQLKYADPHNHSGGAMKFVGALMFLLFLCNGVLAQEKQADQKQPSTELEAFLQTKGQIIVKEFHDLSAIAGQYGARLTIGTLVLYEPNNPERKKRGLRIEVKSGGRGEREHTSFLDLDEIEALSKGIAYMTTIANEWQGKNREYSEVVLSTKGDFHIGFYTSEGKLTAFAKSGHIGSVDAVLSMDSLQLLKTAADRGMEYLNGK